MDIMLNVFSICNGIVTDMADSMGGISEAMVSLPAEMQTGYRKMWDFSPAYRYGS